MHTSSLQTKHILNGYIHTYNRNRSSLHAAKLVVSHPLWQGSLSLGGEYAYAHRTNSYHNPEGLMADDNSRINELTAAGFAEYSRSWGKVNLQAGVRYEHVDFDYYEQDKHMDEQNRTYDNLFPSPMRTGNYPRSDIGISTFYLPNN